MSKAPSPLLGFNNNVRHKGRVFHIQTEDSGIRHPHIITHLFMDGGRIVKTVKTSYAEHVGQDGYADKVRAMMKEQHKGMFVALRDGTLDAVIEAKAGAGTGVTTSGAVAVPPPPPSEQVTMEAERVALPPPPPDDEVPVPQRTTESEIDVSTLERAASAASQRTSEKMRVSTPGLNHDDLPPPPANVMKTSVKPEGGYREVGSDARRSRPPSVRPASEKKPGERVPQSGKRPTRPPTVPPPRGAAVSRPASIFARTTPPPVGKSIFGEDLISEQSLDEVILSYLAEDLDASPSKK